MREEQAECIACIAGDGGPWGWDGSLGVSWVWVMFGDWMDVELVEVWAMRNGRQVLFKGLDFLIPGFCSRA